MGKLKIKLIIANAKGLYDEPLYPPLQSTVDHYCKLWDDNKGFTPNGKIEDFESTATINEDVKWEGETSSHGYSVAIFTIVYDPDIDNDVNFFDKTTIPSKKGTTGRSANVTAKVKNDESLKGKLDVYTINFKIYASPSEFKQYSIDPKLKIDQ